jgi:hypothetical protein
VNLSKNLRRLLSKAQDEPTRLKPQKRLLAARRRHLAEVAKSSLAKALGQGQVVKKKELLHKVSSIIGADGNSICHPQLCIDEIGVEFRSKWSGTDMP